MKRSVDSFKISPYTSAEIIAVKVDGAIDMHIYSQSNVVSLCALSFLFSVRYYIYSLTEALSSTYV